MKLIYMALDSPRLALLSAAATQQHQVSVSDTVVQRLRHVEPLLSGNLNCFKLPSFHLRAMCGSRTITFVTSSFHQARIHWYPPQTRTKCAHILHNGMASCSYTMPWNKTTHNTQGMGWHNMVECMEASIFLSYHSVCLMSSSQDIRILKQASSSPDTPLRASLEQSKFIPF